MAIREPMAAREPMRKTFPVEFDGLTWLAVHGTLCLGLRHPEYLEPLRGLVLSFVRHLGHRLIENGVLTIDELAVAYRLEQEESPHGAK